MPAYVINYDLRKPGRNYDALYAKLKSYSKWGKVTESCWVVVTEKSAVTVRDELKSVIDTNDRLFVVKSGTEAAWRHSICDNDWLKANL